MEYVEYFVKAILIAFMGNYVLSVYQYRKERDARLAEWREWEEKNAK